MNIIHRSTVLFLLLTWSVGQVCAETIRLINTRDMYPSASPDGKQLVFQSNRGGSNQIFIMNMNGSEIRQFGDFPLGAETPVFSPDGQRTAIASNRTGPALTSQIWTMNPDGSNLSTICVRIGKQPPAIDCLVCKA